MELASLPPETNDAFFAFMNLARTGQFQEAQRKLTQLTADYPEQRARILHEGTWMLISYGNPEQASDALEAFERAFSANSLQSRSESGHRWRNSRTQVAPKVDTGGRISGHLWP